MTDHPLVHEPQEEYAGPARLGDRDVHVRLRGHFEPIDGRFHWWGRVGEALEDHEPGASVVLTTPHGTAEARLSDLDPWGRLRVSGTGAPPF